MKSEIITMSINGFSIREIVRVLDIIPNLAF